MACEFCYYLPKTKRSSNSDFRISHDLLADFTRQMIDAQPGGQVTFTWQGSEPTLIGLEFFQKTVQLQKEFAPAGIWITNVIQTNGLILTPDWCRFFKGHNFLVGLSLEWPPDLHNAYRHDPIGRRAFPRFCSRSNYFRCMK